MLGLADQVRGQDPGVRRAVRDDADLGGARDLVYTHLAAHGVTRQVTRYILTSAANRLISEVVQSRRRPLLVIRDGRFG